MAQAPKQGSKPFPFTLFLADSPVIASSSSYAPKKLLSWLKKQKRISLRAYPLSLLSGYALLGLVSQDLVGQSVYLDFFPFLDLFETP